ncbi:hypothetical protein MBLNU13_g03973t1 [Cladosporium sp. NU13]
MSMNYTDFAKMAGGDSSGSASNNASSSDDAETIYFLETSTPHLYDISVSGPYYPLDAIIPQVLRNFGEACLHEFIRDGHVVGFERITSPINNNPNKTKTIRLAREHNPTLASRLPSPAWVIMLLDMDIIQTLPGAFTHPPVRSLIPKGSFATQNEANTRLQQIAAELVASIPDSRVIDRSALTPGVLPLAILNDRSGNPPVGFSLTANRQ